jgi:hypothetical protein
MQSRQALGNGCVLAAFLGASSLPGDGLRIRNPLAAEPEIVLDHYLPVDD